MPSRLAVIALLASATFSLPVVACSIAPPHPSEVASMPGIAIGIVTAEYVSGSSHSGEYEHSRSVTVRIDSVLAGSFPATIMVATSCGLAYAPKHSRVVVFYNEPDIYDVWEADGGFESSIRAALENSANSSFKPMSLRRIAQVRD